MTAEQRVRLAGRRDRDLRFVLPILRLYRSPSFSLPGSHLGPSSFG
jgi:hypothetical protein